MSLYNKLRNQRLEWLQDLIRQLNQELAGISSSRLQTFLQERGETDPSFIDDLLTPTEGPRLFEVSVDGQEFFPLSPEAIPIRPQIAEWQWLRWVLSDPRIDWFIEPELKAKLIQGIPDFPSALGDVISRPFSPMTRAITDRERQCVKAIIKAIRDSTMIEMNYIAADGKSIISATTPVQLEYDQEVQELYLLHIDAEQHQLHKAKIAQIKAVKLLDVTVNRALVMDTFERRLKSRERIAELYINLDKSGLERTFHTLAAFEKEALPMKNGYKVNVWYHGFDEERLITKILSLGPTCTVLAPQRLQDEVISRVKACL